MDAKSVYQLAVTSKDQFATLQEENQNLKLTLEAQKNVISELSESMPDLDKTEQSLQELNKVDLEISEQLRQAQSILLELLTSKPKQQENPSEILKTILGNFSEALLASCLEAPQKGQQAVSIFDLMTMEEEASKIIEKLQGSDMYPETDEMKDKREKRTQAHAQKLAQFLTILKAVLNQQTKQQE